MKPLNIINKLIITIFAAVMACSCHEIEYSEPSAGNTITSMTLSALVPQADDAMVYRSFNATIDQDNGTIRFAVPQRLSDSDPRTTDLSKVLLNAVIPVGAVITPGLSGEKDLTEPLYLTVKAANGNERHYVVIAVLE